MRKLRFVQTLALAIPLLAFTNGCILIPQLEDRVVELAVGASTTASFVASGQINMYDQSQDVDIHADVNLRQVLDDNNVDASNVKGIKVAGLSYRIVKAEVGRTITGGSVEVARGPGPVVPTTDLVTSFSADAGKVGGWKTVALSAPGVTLLNGLLNDLLLEVQNGTPATNTDVSYRIQGVSNPTGTPTNFTWEIKLDITMVGSVKVKVPN